ncbi:hypothetical protein [Halomonas nitroreducens]|uniref:Uncharacterized protein n=1 Tax=Halomonas nitroreducens TaxID=447425 RepID=A0A3S0I6X8_9GAMM|nr:hypothetical protein [Halomonas nitroreducens]RTR01957.1 hypothetical protein EKG36_13190 [Halomonas nitroreducens]
MTERHHPSEDQARALAESERFCEWLDATAATPHGWPHNRTTAKRWLERACGVESLGWLATNRQASDRLRDIARRFDAWDRNEELAV